MVGKGEQSLAGMDLAFRHFGRLALDTHLEFTLDTLRDDLVLLYYRSGSAGILMIHTC